MKTLTLILAAFGVSGLLVAAQQTPPPDVAGAWEVEDVPIWTIELVANGTVVTGKVMQGGLEHEIFDGTLAGNTLSFKARSADGDRIIAFTGQVEGEVIRFTREVTIVDGGVAGGNAIMGGNGPNEFTVRRVDPDRWTGTGRNAPTQRNPTPNPNPRPAMISTLKVPDPHWRWRGGEKEITVRRFTFANASFELDRFEVADDLLAYAFRRPQGDEIRCELSRQPQGDFGGMCRSMGGGNFAIFITLTPPATAGGRAPGRS